ncbi:MAG TPA: hypothetical protein VHV78_01095, partial [Gemmatimonadaceae bacterium]|nr:hypothetical protein [Gemmatimonadaceae bacterium]
MGLTVGAAAAGLARAGTPPWLGAARHGVASRPTAGADPDLVVFNAKVYTMDPDAPRAEAFAVSGGRFVAVGSSADITGLAGKRTERLDAKQMTIVPGFTDC